MNINDMIKVAEELSRVSTRYSVLVAIEDYEWVAPQLEALGLVHGWHPCVPEGSLYVLDNDRLEQPPAFEMGHGTLDLGLPTNHDRWALRRDEVLSHYLYESMRKPDPRDIVRISGV